MKAASEDPSYQVNVEVIPYSGAALVRTEMNLRFRVAGAEEWTRVSLVEGPVANIYFADIPGFPAGTAVEYYVEAADDSGRRECAPRVAPEGFYAYTVDA